MYINQDIIVYDRLGKTKEERTVENFVNYAARNTRFSSFFSVSDPCERECLVKGWIQQVQTLIDIIENYGYKWDFFCESRNNENYGIVYYFGDTVIESETGGKMPLFDIYVALPISFGDGMLEKIGIRHVYFSRTTFNKAEFYKEYIHSHISSSYFSNVRGDDDNHWYVELDYDDAILYKIPQFGDVCLGDTEINTNVNRLSIGIYENLSLEFELLINQIASFVSWESITGVPYLEIKPVINTYLYYELNMNTNSFATATICKNMLFDHNILKKEDFLVTQDEIKLKYDERLYKKVSDYVNSLNLQTVTNAELYDDGNVTRVPIYGYAYHEESMPAEEYEELGEPDEEQIFAFVFQGKYIPLLEAKGLQVHKQQYVFNSKDFNEMYNYINSRINDEYLHYKVNLVKI